MASTASLWTVLLLAVVLANLPFLNERVLAVMPRPGEKGMGVRLLELLLYTGVTIAVGRGLESLGTQAAPQGWQFYAVMVCVMLTLAFPGFVWRYLRRRH